MGELIWEIFQYEKSLMEFIINVTNDIDNNSIVKSK